MRELVSIIVPIYNRAQFLVETIASVLAQTYPHWELLLVDDGSTDGSFELASQYAVKDSRIRATQRNRLPKGAPTCRNIGLESAKGDYIMFLDSDDLLAPYCLEQRIGKFKEHPQNDFIVFPMLIFKETINDTRRLTNYSTHENDLYRFLRSDIVWQTSAPLWRKYSFEKLGGFDEGFPNCQDHELHLRALFNSLRYEHAFEVKPDVFYRNHNLEKIYQPSDPLRVLKGINMLFRKISNEYSEIIKVDRKAKKNVFIFLFSTSRMYLRNGESREPRLLVNMLFKNDTINFGAFFLLRIYILLSTLGMNRIRGFERIWKAIIPSNTYPMSWGKKMYEGDL